MANGSAGTPGLQLREFVAEGRADEVATRAEDLPELDERGAEFGEHHPDAGLSACRSERRPMSVLAAQRQDVTRVEPRGCVGQPVLRERAGNFRSGRRRSGPIAGCR